MSNIGANSILTIPDGGDIFSRQAYVDNLTAIEQSLKHRIGMQTSYASGTYVADALLQAYSDGAGFVFVPISPNTGACSINVNSLGAKALCDNAGNAMAAGALRAYHLYLLQYSSALNGGSGGFYSWELNDVLTALIAHESSGDHDSRYYTQAQVNALLSGYLIEYVAGTYSTPGAFNAANPYSLGVFKSAAGEIQWASNGPNNSVMYSMMVNVPAGATVTIPTVYVDDVVFMFVDGLQKFTHAPGSGGPYSDSVTLAAGPHLIQFITQNTSGAPGNLLVAQWFGSSVQFLRAAKS